MEDYLRSLTDPRPPTHRDLVLHLCQRLKFKPLNRSTVPTDWKKAFDACPLKGEKVRIRGKLPGMWEPALIAGYMVGTNSMMALVLYLDLWSGDEREFDLVPVDRIREWVEPKPARSLFSRPGNKSRK